MAIMLLIGCTLFSCKNENLATLQSRETAAIDSIVNAKLVPVRNDLLAGCQASVDSLIVASADAILLEADSKKTLVPAIKPKTTKPKTTPKAKSTPAKTNQIRTQPKLENAPAIKKPALKKPTGNSGKKKSGTKAGTNQGKKKSGTTTGVNKGKKKKKTTP